MTKEQKKRQRIAARTAANAAATQKEQRKLFEERFRAGEYKQVLRETADKLAATGDETAATTIFLDGVAVKVYRVWNSQFLIQVDGWQQPIGVYRSDEWEQHYSNWADSSYNRLHGWED